MEHNEQRIWSDSLLQASTTLAGIAVALAAVPSVRTAGPIDLLPRGLPATPVLLLCGGLFALTASMYCMVAMWREAGMSARDLVFAQRRAVTNPNEALGWIFWALAVLTVVYIVILIDIANTEVGAS